MLYRNLQQQAYQLQPNSPITWYFYGNSSASFSNFEFLTFSHAPSHSQLRPIHFTLICSVIERESNNTHTAEKLPNVYRINSVDFPNAPTPHSQKRWRNDADRPTRTCRTSSSRPARMWRSCRHSTRWDYARSCCVLFTPMVCVYHKFMHVCNGRRRRIHKCCFGSDITSMHCVRYFL